MFSKIIPSGEICSLLHRRNKSRYADWVAFSCIVRATLSHEQTSFSKGAVGPGEEAYLFLVGTGEIFMIGSV